MPGDMFCGVILEEKMVKFKITTDGETCCFAA
jgi:hypothetical protein